MNLNGYDLRIDKELGEYSWLLFHDGVLASEGTLWFKTEKEARQHFYEVCMFGLSIADFEEPEKKPAKVVDLATYKEDVERGIR